MYVVSVNVRFGGANVAERAGRIARSVKSRVPNFESVLFLVQECSADAMRAIRREVSSTHEAFARPNYRMHIGPFVATFVPRAWRDRGVSVSWRRAPYTKMRRDYHAIRVRAYEKKEKEGEKEGENETAETEKEEKKEEEEETKKVTVYNVHLDSCKESRRTREAQVRFIARETTGPFAILGDLNERAKHVSRGLETRVATWRARGTDHKARLYRITL